MEWFIQIHRQMLEWEWYDDINTKVLFIHLLIKANWKEKNWRGINIERWEYITSLSKLSEETWLSLQQVRTSIKKLKSTWEVTHKWQGAFSLIKVIKYDNYQTSNTKDNKPVTNEQQTSNKEVTTTNKDNKEINKTILSKDKMWELEKIIEHRNKVFKEKRQVTIDLQKAYKNLRTKYSYDEFKEWYSKYCKEKVNTEKQYVLSPLSFMKQSNWFPNYL